MSDTNNKTSTSGENCFGRAHISAKAMDRRNNSQRREGKPPIPANRTRSPPASRGLELVLVFSYFP